MTSNDDATPEALAEIRVETGDPGIEQSIQRRPYEFPGKLYPPWELKGDGDNWPDEPEDWYDFKEDQER